MPGPVNRRTSGPLLTTQASRADMPKDGWKGVGKVLALALDVVYQIIVLRFVYPGEAIIVAFILAILPYLILRGLVTRLARKNEIAAPPLNGHAGDTTWFRTQLNHYKRR